MNHISEWEVQFLIREWIKQHPEKSGINGLMFFDDLAYPYLNTDEDVARWEVEACDADGTYKLYVNEEGDDRNVHIETTSEHPYYRDHASAHKIALLKAAGYDKPERGLSEGRYDVLNPEEWEKEKKDPETTFESEEEIGDVSGNYIAVTYWI